MLTDTNNGPDLRTTLSGSPKVVGGEAAVATLDINNEVVISERQNVEWTTTVTAPPADATTN